MDARDAWLARLAELRAAIDGHLKAAEALADLQPRADRARRRMSRRAKSAAQRHVRPAAGDARPSLRNRRAPGDVARAPSAVLKRALDHVAAHYDQPLNLAQLARIAGCSREHLARACRRETGSTIHAHLVRLRLTRAAREVRAGDKIEAVMLGVGYRGKRNFYEQFKARFGVTPGRYRVEAGDRDATEDDR